MKFNYKARTKQGEAQNGVIEASSRKAALYILEKDDLYITSLVSISQKNFLNVRISLQRTSVKDVVIFTRQFSVMLKSGISPVEALQAQANQTTNSDFHAKILRMAEVVEGGRSLSQAFGMFPDVFKSFFINVVRAGEATGKMADSLKYLADHLEREYNFNRKIKSAMIYPAFVILVFIGVFFLAVFFIMPKLMEILKSFSGELPLATKVMIVLSEGVRDGGWIAIIALLVLLFFVPNILRRRKSTRDMFDRFILRVPILGSFQKKVYLTRICENLSVLIASGLPITQALQIVKDMIENSLYKKIVAQAEDKVAKGEKISAIFSEYPDQVPTFVLQMTSTGESTGRLDETLMDVVNFYREEIERITDNLTTILEPLLILFLGLGVAVLAISVFVPLFKIGLGGVG